MKDKLKTWWYELIHGHPFLLDAEVDIICKTRDEPKFEHFNDREIQQIIQIRIDDMYEQVKKEKKCQLSTKHKAPPFW